MRSRFSHVLCSLVALCCVAVSQTRAQEATSQPAKKPAAKKPAKKTAATKPAADKSAAKKTTGAKPAADATAKQSSSAKQTAPPAATKKAATSTVAKQVAVKKPTRAKSAGATEAAKDTAEKPAGAKSVEEKTAGEKSVTKVETEKASLTSVGAEKSKPKARAQKPKAESKSADSESAETKPAESKTEEDKSAESKPDETKTAKTQDAASAKAVASKKPDGSPKEAELKSKLEEILKLPPWERIAELDDFLDLDLSDALAARAEEYLVSAQAAYGDDRLRAGDAARGVALFRDAVATASAEMSDKLYFEVVSQLPTNLAMRGQPEAAFDLARRIEKKANKDARRLLALAGFYLSLERTDEATRLASEAVKLAPDLAAAHQALAAAHRLSLRLDESAAEYARAAELDPKSAGARRSLADLRRATGKPEEALKLYREQLAADPKDVLARAGVVLSLFDAGKREEAERELDAALKDDARNLQLLVGAAYWYAAHAEQKRAVELATQAIQIEPRHPWAQVAVARALIASGVAVEAERALRFARLYSRFPTLDYELASALAAAGLYAEAAEELNRSFALKDDQIEARLAGRATARADNFIDLLAPERRASLFEPQAADTQENARSMKGLLALHLALKSTETDEKRAAAEPSATRAAREFAEAGDSQTRIFRQLYAANRLLRRGVGARAALELAEGAKSGVAAALDAPQATVAVTADELRDLREQAIVAGGTPNVPVLPRDVLEKLLRGRAEEMIGWAQLNDGRAAEAVATLRRAVGVLPENSLYWRNALWRLGNALAANKEPAEALDTYVKSYDPATSDATRRAVIEGLYRKLNGSLAGLDVLIGAAHPMRPAPLAPSQPAPVEAAKGEAVKTDHAPSISETKGEEKKDAATKIVEAKSDEAKVAETKDAAMKRDATKSDTAKSDAPKAVETPAQPTPTPAEVAPSPEPSASPSPTPAPPVAEAKSESKKGDAAAPASEKPIRSQTARASREGECALALSSEEVSLAVGGQASFVATLEGDADAAKIAATTADWADIIVLREPATVDGSAKFTITSISKSAGAFAVTLKSPCGTKKVSVTVK